MIPYALPPAETWLPIRTIIHGYGAGSTDFALKLQSFFGAGTCVLADSARSLLYLVFRHLREHAGSSKTEVLMPGYTCYSLPAAAVKAGLQVALYDVDPDTLRSDPKDVSDRINANTLAVVGQHLLGMRSDIGRLADAAHRHGVYCIEDSAQLLPREDEVNGRIGDADYTVFSFGRGKPLPLGKGGALLVRNPEDADAISRGLEMHPDRMGNCLMPAAVLLFSRPRVYWLMEKLPLGLGQTIYDPGFEISKMPVYYKRMGTRALEALFLLNGHREAIGRIYHLFFSGGQKDLHARTGPAYVRYPLMVEKNGNIAQLYPHGVRRLYPRALCDVEPLKPGLAKHSKPTPGAREIAQRLITLPTHLSVNRSVAKYIAEEVDKMFPVKRAVRQR